MNTYVTESKFYLVENCLKRRGWKASPKKEKKTTMVWLNTKKAMRMEESAYCNHVRGVREIVYKSDLAKTLMSEDFENRFLAPPAHALNDPNSFLRFQRDFVVLLCFSLVLNVSESSSPVLMAAMDVLHLKSSSQLFMSCVPDKMDMVRYSLFLSEFGTSSSCLISLHEKSRKERLSTSVLDSIRSIVSTFESKYPKALLSTHNMWILKPGASSKGNNIRVLRDFSEIVRLTARCKVEGKSPKDGFVAMRYIENPFLLPPTNCNKFDLRRWVLLHSKSDSEVEVYMLTDAYARVCRTT